MCLPSKQPTRQDRLRGFLAEHRVTQRRLGELLGVTEAYVGQILAGKRRPQHYIDELVKLGIPRDLLPENSQKKSD